MCAKLADVSLELGAGEVKPLGGAGEFDVGWWTGVEPLDHLQPTVKERTTLTCGPGSEVQYGGNIARGGVAPTAGSRVAVLPRHALKWRTRSLGSGHRLLFVLMLAHLPRSSVAVHGEHLLVESGLMPLVTAQFKQNRPWLGFCPWLGFRIGGQRMTQQRGPAIVRLALGRNDDVEGTNGASHGDVEYVELLARFVPLVRIDRPSSGARQQRLK